MERGYVRSMSTKLPLRSSLKHLFALRSDAVIALADVDRRIAQHPDTIAKYFTRFAQHHLLAEIIAQVEEVAPWSDTVALNRKEDVQGHGFVFRMRGDDGRYWMRYASNGWSDSMQDCGRFGDEKSPNIEMARLYEGRGASGSDHLEPETLDWIATILPWRAVGHMLRCYVGW
jgi:hypothetical protein